MNRPFFLFLCLLLLAGSGGQAGLFSQEPDLSYVVTAGRTPQEADSVPALITVITQEEIARSGASELAGILDTLPGIQLRGAMNGAGSEEISMRGFGENSFARVLVLVDGKRQNNPDMKGINWNAIPLSDIERIEVLDGSASVLYGNNAVAGVINIVTKKSGGNRTWLSAALGSFLENRQLVSHQQGTPWGRFSLAAEHTGREGYRDRQASQTTNVSAQTTVDFTDTVSLSVEASLADLYYQLPGYLIKEQFEADPTRAVNWDDENREHHYGGGLNLDWFPAETLEIHLPVSYAFKTIDGDMASRPSYTTRVLHAGEARPFVSKVFDLAGGDLALGVQGGADFYYAHLNVKGYSAPDRNTETSSYGVSQMTLGPYLNFRLDILSLLTLNAGVRYDMALVNARKAAAKDRKFQQALVYEGGAVYRPLEFLKVFAKFGTFFRYPLADELVEGLGWGALNFNNDLDPERGFNAEAGAELSLGKAFTAGGNFYFMGLRDEIVYDNSLNTNVNLDDTRRLGTSVNVKYRPFSFLELQGGYAFVDARFSQGPHEGRRIPLVSAHSARGGVNLFLPAGFRLSAEADYRGDARQGGDAANVQEKISGYWVFDMTLRYVWEKDRRRLSVQAAARNLFDVSYAPAVYYSNYYPADGRSFVITVNYQF